MSLNKKRVVIALTMALMGSQVVMAQSLEESVAEVLANNPQINATFSEFKAGSYAYLGARAGYYPSLDVNAGIGYEQTNTVLIDDAALTRREIGVSLTQILFDGFATTGEVGRSKSEAQSLQYGLYADAEDLALNVTKVYLDVRKNEQILEMSERNRDIHQKIYYDIEKRSGAGLGSTADLSQISGRLSRADANLLAAKNNLLDAKTQYLRLVNAMPENLVDPIADAEMIPTELETALKLATDNHPLIKSTRFGINSALSEHDVAQSGYYPTFYVELGANFNNNIDGLEGKNEDLTAMLRLKYNLFQGARDYAKDKQGTYRINLAKETNRDVVRQVEEGTRLSWAALTTLTKQLEFLQQHVEQSFDTVKAYKKQFGLGKRTLLDLLNTENELFDARKAYVAAQYGQIFAQYRILNSTGQLLNSMRVVRPQQWQEL